MQANFDYFEERRPLYVQLGATSESVPKLRTYIRQLWTANAELNLFSRKMSFEELIDNHLIDCLLSLKYFPAEAQAAADFGSGGGFPGVVYAIQFPQTRFYLFEKSVRKREFLARCRDEVAPNLVIESEIPKVLPPVEIVTARAFKPIDVLLEMSRSYFEKGGMYHLLKGRREKIDEEISQARKKFKGLKVEIHPLNSPVLDVERHLVEISI